MNVWIGLYMSIYKYIVMLYPNQNLKDARNVYLLIQKYIVSIMKVMELFWNENVKIQNFDEFPNFIFISLMISWPALQAEDKIKSKLFQLTEELCSFFSDT